MVRGLQHKPCEERLREKPGEDKGKGPPSAYKEVIKKMEPGSLK